MRAGVDALLRALPARFRRAGPRRSRSRDELAQLELLQSQLMRALAMQREVMRLEDDRAAPGTAAGPAPLIAALMDGALRHVVHAAARGQAPDGRLHEALRLRLAEAGGSTEVTVPGAAALHNAWRELPTRTLFDEYERAEKLQNSQGSGVNVELALVAMLTALVVNRGRS